MRILWTIGPFTILELVLCESADAQEQEAPAPTVIDMSTAHDRGFGFDAARWQMPPLNGDPYWDDPFDETRERS